MLPINNSQAYDSYKLGHFTLTQMFVFHSLDGLFVFYSFY